MFLCDNVSRVKQAVGQCIFHALSPLTGSVCKQQEDILDLLIMLPSRALVAQIKDELVCLCQRPIESDCVARSTERSAACDDSITDLQALAVLQHVQRSLTTSQHVLQAGIWWIVDIHIHIYIYICNKYNNYNNNTHVYR
jgi:hypothetical protein